MAQQTSSPNLHVKHSVFQQNGDVVISVLHFQPGASTPTKLSNQTLRVFEGSTELQNISVRCKDQSTALPVSSVLAIDVSGSMHSGSPKNIFLATSAAEAWIEALNDSSECAITSFDHHAYLTSPFTQNKTALLRALPSLKPQGGTSFDAGLLSPTIGALHVAKDGKHKRVVVFLTDGNGGGNISAMVALARDANITVYCVSLGKPMPYTLKRLAEESGGLWFENVTTVTEAQLAYRRIYIDATYPEPCLASFALSPNCKNKRDLKVYAGSDSVLLSITIPDSLSGNATVSQKSITLGVIPPGVPQKRSFVIYGKNINVTVGSVVTSNPSLVSVSTPPMPHTIQSSDSMVIECTIIPADTSYTTVSISVNTAPCPVQPLYITFGSMYMQPSTPTVHIVSPNGGERYSGGSAITLEYDGVSPDVPVNLDVSTNGGKTFSRTHTGITAHHVIWKSPAIVSDSCLLRVTMAGTELPEKGKVYSVSDSRYKSVSFTNDGRYLITSGWEQSENNKSTTGVVRVVDAITGSLRARLPGSFHCSSIFNNNSFVSWGEKNIVVWNVDTWTERWRKPYIPTNNPINVEGVSDGTKILVVGGFGDSTLLVQTSNGEVLQRFPRKARDVRWGTISRNGKAVAICERDSAIRIYSAENGTLIQTITNTPAVAFYKAMFTNNGETIIATLSNGTVAQWNISTGQKIRELAKRQYVNDNTYLDISKDDSRVIVESAQEQSAIIELASGRTITLLQRDLGAGGAAAAQFNEQGTQVVISGLYTASVFDAKDGELLLQSTRYEGLPSFHPTNNTIAIINQDTTVTVFNVQRKVVQQDVSDAFWSLYTIDANIKDVRLASRLIGQSQDSVVSGALENLSRDTMIVEQMYIDGKQAKDFGIRTTLPIIIPPKSRADIEYNYTPSAPGERAALLVAIGNFGKIAARITAPSPAQIAAAHGNIFDLGSLHQGDEDPRMFSSVLENIGTAPITITDAKIGPNDTSFIIDIDIPVTLQPKSSLPMAVRFIDTAKGLAATRIEFSVENGKLPIISTVVARRLNDTVRKYSDPTTFRSIVLPTAIVPKAGTFTVASYDVLGLVASYSITDNFAVLAGGILPINNAWLGTETSKSSTTYSGGLGIKTGWEIAKNIVIGGGYQLGFSSYSQHASNGYQSDITFHALWSTLGWGTDASRLNVYLGYALKNHATSTQKFTADATILGIAYDYTIASQWKLCAETFFMRTMPVVPVTITARYFTDNFAIEGGLTYIGISASGESTSAIPLLPVLSYVHKF